MLQAFKVSNVDKENSPIKPSDNFDERSNFKCLRPLTLISIQRFPLKLKFNKFDFYPSVNVIFFTKEARNKIRGKKI